ncbi:MAG: hypothetical protein MUC78_06390 [Bacteroidales bacterium]|jgi:hypothetical protein|nr:hypothetical protein [Bacteroidales bacterium]
MNKVILQRVAFIIFASCAFLNPILDMFPWFGYTLLAGALFYLGLGWYLPMISDNSHRLANELVGYVYSTVFIANMLEARGMPMGTTLVWYSDILALALMIFMIVRRKSVRRDMLIQSVVLWMVSPVPLFV